VITVERNDALSRYEGRLADEIVTVINFVRTGNVVDITHTRTRVRWRGQGLAGKVTEAALADIRAQAWKVQASCPFTVDYLHAHPGHADIRV
jgi:predicted GNAT family acetyltransferase